ncbi:MAG: hypothetical protein J7L43_02055 [Candidatus Aenigmarchaeota archaeon]|nr:hypothetical protein [Candidatus Aenigmarchaeota archaeon]
MNEKIKQAYVNSELLDIDESDPFVFFEAGYKSRDPEVHRLEQVAIENSNGFNVLKIDVDQQAEEIDRLNKMIDRMLLTMVKFGIEQTETNQEALGKIDAETV